MSTALSSGIARQALLFATSHRTREDSLDDVMANTKVYFEFLQNPTKPKNRCRASLEEEALGCAIRQRLRDESLRDVMANAEVYLEFLQEK